MLVLCSLNFQSNCACKNDKEYLLFLASFKILSLGQKGSKARLKSATGDSVWLQKLSQGTPVRTQMLSSPESVTAPLPLCSLWKCTWGDLPPQHPLPQNLCLLLSRATWEVSNTSISSPAPPHVTAHTVAKPVHINTHKSFQETKPCFESSVKLFWN